VKLLFAFSCPSQQGKDGSAVWLARHVVASVIVCAAVLVATPLCGVRNRQQYACPYDL
jgi:hypothetical protein